VHPEAYPLVERILADIGKDIRRSDRRLANCSRRSLPENYIDDRFGLPTVRDILRELEKPGRDPRPEFRTANFREGVEAVKDLQRE
jgi:uncharacterized protein